MKAIGKLAGLIILVLVLATPALAGACDHPYVPLSPSHSKTFAVKNKIDGSSEQYTISVAKLTANSFELHYGYPKVELTIPFTCTPAGFTSPQFGLGRAVGPSGSVTYHVTSSSGAVIAPPDHWKVGGSWTHAGQGTATAASGQTYTFKNEMTFQVVAQERVQVPAGTFDALKVVLTQKGEFGAGGYNQPINYTLNQWYALGTGLVRQEDQSAIHEMVSYKR